MCEWGFLNQPHIAINSIKKKQGISDAPAPTYANPTESANGCWNVMSRGIQYTWFGVDTIVDWGVTASIRSVISQNIDILTQVFAHGQPKFGQMGKLIWRCTTRGQEGSNKLDLELIGPLVDELQRLQSRSGRTDGPYSYSSRPQRSNLNAVTYTWLCLYVLV